MNWYYVEDGRQAGPVDEAGLNALVASGKIRPETLVWREGMANWQPYREVHPPAPSAAAAPPSFGSPAAAGAEAVCAECGGLFPLNDTILIGNARVCANCKPIFVQKMREGVPQSFATAANLTEEQILAREYRVDVGSAVSRAWAAFTNNAGIMLGTLLIMAVVFLVFAAVGLVLRSIIPLSNNLLTIFYAMPMAGGMLWFALRLVRGEPAEVGDSFAGFKTHYVSLIGFGALQFLVNIICALPVIITAVALGLSAVFLSRGKAASVSAAWPAGMMLVGLIGAGVVTLCCLAFVNTMFCYVALLIVDKNYRVWPAIRLSGKMVMRGWWITFGFLLVRFLLYLLGAMMCLVGVLATGPLYLNMKAVLYDDNFRDLAPRP